MAKNIFGKMRSIDKPYAVYRSPIGKHFILKTYKMEKNEVIKSIQGNENIYVTKPIKLFYDMNDWYNLRV